MAKSIEERIREKQQQIEKEKMYLKRLESQEKKQKRNEETKLKLQLGKILLMYAGNDLNAESFEQYCKKYSRSIALINSTFPLSVPPDDEGELVEVLDDDEDEDWE